MNDLEANLFWSIRVDCEFQSFICVVLLDYKVVEKCRSELGLEWIGSLINSNCTLVVKIRRIVIIEGVCYAG